MVNSNVFIYHFADLDLRVEILFEKMGQQKMESLNLK